MFRTHGDVNICFLITIKNNTLPYKSSCQRKPLCRNLASVDVSKWKSQLRKGLLEYALLHLIRSRKRVYGLEIIEAITQAGLEMSEGTLYPLLSRLHRQKLLGAEWDMNSASGHPRKYYLLSAHGARVLQAMDSEWKSISNTMSRFQGEKK